jgi:hypothetical protein
MSKDLTDVDTFSSPIHVPEGTDSRNDAAGDVELIAQRLANRTHYLNLRAAFKAIANTFTAGQAIDVASASTPLLTTTTDSQDHPSSPANKWKLELRFPLADGTSWRLYVGDGTGGAGGNWIITTNAVWDPASGGQSWSKDDTSKISTAVWAGPSGGFSVFQKNAGAGTWTSSWDVGVGNILVGGDVSVGDDLNVTGDAVVGGTITATGEISGGDISAGDDLFAGDNVNVTNLVQYVTPPTRTKQVNLLGLLNQANGTEPTFGEGITLNGSGIVNIPLQLPHGAVLGVCRVKLGAGDYDVRAFRKHSINMTNSSVPTVATVDTDSGTSGSVHNVSVDFGGLTVSKDEFYWISVFNTHGSNTLDVEAVDMSFVDPGPRNH